MATHVYRFAVQDVPMPSGLGGGFTPTNIPLAVYTDVSADDTQLTDLTNAMAQQGYVLFATDPAAPTDMLAAFRANSKLLQTVSYAGRGTAFTSAVRTFGTVNNGAEVYNASTAGVAITKLSSTSKLYARLSIGGFNSVAGTTANAIKAMLGYTTVNTAGTSFSSSSIESGTLHTTATSNGAWTAPILWEPGVLTQATYYFYIRLVALTSGTLSIPAADGTTGGVSLIIQEIQE